MRLFFAHVVLRRREALLIHICTRVDVRAAFLSWHELQRLHLGRVLETCLFAGSGGHALEAEGRLRLAGKLASLWVKTDVGPH